MASTRPTQYTHCAVSRTITVRDVNNIIELDPVVSKRGLFKEYDYVHGYKIKPTANGNGIESPDDDNEDNQIYICSWGFFVQFWKTIYPKLVI